ncbi:MAG: sodium:proton antiporter [Eggerthellaceae bacterium]|nr:sodium:proton antiporter [Eggerthellaceae bacterium]
MEIMELFLVLVTAVLLSALLDKALPHVAAPLVQVAIGLAMALALSISPVIEADTELFMMLFIAPLLFYESKELDKAALWKDKGTVLCLSIGLVLVMMVLVGMALHFVFPGIPIALCFAVGAALGPTDAAAVVALARSTKFPKRIEGVLAAEAIFNDATGVVAFEFAVAAAISGVFEPAVAAGSFLAVFVGGLLCGAVLGALGNWVTTLVRNGGMVSMTFHVLFEIAMPFLAFIVGEGIGVSGILSAVACGLVFDLGSNGTGADVSMSKIVSNGVWKVASFALNGIVFVLLGLQLPNGVEAIISHDVDTVVGFSGVALVLGIVVSFRFLWCVAIAKASRRGWGDGGTDLGLLRTAGLLTFGGAKGAITMAAILTMPSSMSGRGVLVFVTSCVIVATLLLANVAMPRLAPKAETADADEQRRQDEARLYILRLVLARLREVSEEYDADAVAIVAGEYRERIITASGGALGDKESRKLRLEAITWEREYLESVARADGYDDKDIEKMRGYLDQKEYYYAERPDWALKTKLGWKRMVSSTLSWAETFAVSLGFPHKRDDDIRRYSDLRSKCAEYALKKLAQRASEDVDNAERISSLIRDYRLDMACTLAYTPQLEDVARANAQAAQLRLEALRWEGELIEEQLDAGKIDESTAKAMRRTVAVIRIDAEDMI